MNNVKKIAKLHLLYSSSFSPDRNFSLSFSVLFDQVTTQEVGPPKPMTSFSFCKSIGKRYHGNCDRYARAQCESVVGKDVYIRLQKGRWKLYGVRSGKYLRCWFSC